MLALANPRTLIGEGWVTLRLNSIGLTGVMPSCPGKAVDVTGNVLFRFSDNVPKKQLSSITGGASSKEHYNLRVGRDRHTGRASTDLRSDIVDQRKGHRFNGLVTTFILNDDIYGLPANGIACCRA